MPNNILANHALAWVFIHFIFTKKIFSTINAVKRLDEYSYSDQDKYWFNEDTGIVYDYELNYPIGKVERDDNGNYVKIKGNVYIISVLLDIPEFKLYD